MTEQAQQQASQDVMALWREWMTQTERQFNALFNQGMTSEPFARSMGGFTEMTSAYQRMVTEGMQRYLTFMNMPSRQDLIGVAETLKSIEDRIAGIEETLQMAAAAVESNGKSAAPHPEPTRTRRPPGVPLADEPASVPDGMRR